MSAGARGLAELHLDALYRTDAAGRILAVRDPDVRAPRFHLFRTAEANYWLFRADLPDALVERLDALCRAEPLVEDSERHPPRQLEAILEALGDHREPANHYRGPAFVLDGPLPTPRRAIPIDAEQAALLSPHFEWAASALDTAWPVVASLEEGAAVSLCHSSRLTARAAEAGVETVEAYRRRGHAHAVVAAWARLVRESGRVALYGTSWENFASRAVARALGGRLYGEDLHID